MILSDGTIRELIEKKDLEITPLTDGQIQPASVDCTLGTHFLQVDDNQKQTLDFDHDIKYKDIESDHMIIEPHSFFISHYQ